MREVKDIKFRGWAEHTVNNQWDYAWGKMEDKYDPIEPTDRNSNEWELWYCEREEYRDKTLKEWDTLKLKNQEEYTISHKMITNFMVNEKLQYPHNHKILQVMQFTGILDENKTEIYEGDIVKMDYDIGDGCDPRGKRKKIYILDSYATYVEFQLECGVIGNYDSLEVLGNIFENKVSDFVKTEEQEESFFDELVKEGF